MEIVADHLKIQALQRPLAERDYFGRSAFNRYYYATFLLVKSSLVEMDAGWKGLNHSDIPDTLNGSIVNSLKKGKRQAEKIGDTATVSACSSGISAAKELAKIMANGRATRVTADYHPEEPIDFSSTSGFSLNSVPISDARSWPPKARALISTIQQAWRQIDK